MSKNVCGDCLFRGEAYVWDKGNLCNKHNTRVDEEQTACGNFLPDNHENCYDCEGRKDELLGGFYCTILRKKIKNPSNYVCSNFRY